MTNLRGKDGGGDNIKYEEKINGKRNLISSGKGGEKKEKGITGGGGEGKRKVEYKGKGRGKDNEEKRKAHK